MRLRIWRLARLFLTPPLEFIKIGLVCPVEAQSAKARLSMEVLSGAELKPTVLKVNAVADEV